jgi:hypothetical protein
VRGGVSDSPTGGQIGRVSSGIRKTLLTIISGQLPSPGVFLYGVWNAQKMLRIVLRTYGKYRKRQNAWRRMNEDVATHAARKRWVRLGDGKIEDQGWSSIEHGPQMIAL